MKIDLISIFPAYFDALEVSLTGRARRNGLLDIAVHDLRDYTDDKHRTVDDTPYGGGAGMVMKPEPWARALEQVATSATVLIVPTPSGRRFEQSDAVRLSQQPHVVFACGRYEGIDQRFVDYASNMCPVEEVSLGDFVLNGGEVAALAMLEAIVRLLPGFMGNPESLVEESHAVNGLLEYPVYTKPSTWRDLDVPEVLLSGDHARIAQWRHQQSLARTRQRRPGAKNAT